MRWQIGRFIRAAGQQGGPLFDAEANVSRTLLPVLLANQRADLGVRIGRIAYAQAIGALGEAFNELGVSTLLNKDARAGGAAFAVNREDGEQRGVKRALDIGIFKNQHRRFSASSMEYFFRPAFFMILRPVAVPPVKETARTS